MDVCRWPRFGKLVVFHESHDGGMAGISTSGPGAVESGGPSSPTVAAFLKYFLSA